MKKYSIYLVSVVLLGMIGVSSCTKDFDQLNTDPNRIDQISPGTLLNPIIYSVAGFNMQRSDAFTFNIMQVALPYPSASGGLHRYDIAENTGDGTWNTYYRWLNNVREMYNASIKASDPNYQAIALTLNAWMYSNLTDCFGDVPMSEATRSEEGILHPKFDSQDSIYIKLIASLDSANNLYNTSRSMQYGTEILFANNVAKWKKFTNSLRMRLLLRVSKRSELNSFALLRNMIDNPTKYPVFTTNDESAVLKLTGITPLTSPWGRPVDFTSYRAVAKFFLDSLNATNDPRRAKFATTAKNASGSTSIGYQGIPSGYTGSESQFTFIPSNVNVSLVTASSTSVTPMICPIFPYAEVEFIKAEVELNSNNHTAAKAAYERGVKASIEQWGATMQTDYFTNTTYATTAAYNGTLSRIHLQKYYALYFVDYQAWFEYRRTGYPALQISAGIANKQFPRRFKYPIAVRNINPDNYAKAVKSLGTDDFVTKCWWEK